MSRTPCQQQTEQAQPGGRWEFRRATAKKTEGALADAGAAIKANSIADSKPNRRCPYRIIPLPVKSPTRPNIVRAGQNNQLAFIEP